MSMRDFATAVAATVLVFSTVYAEAEPLPRSSPAAGSVIARKTGEEIRFIEESSWRNVDVKQDLLAGAGTAPVVPVREVVAGTEGEATLRAGGFEQDFIGACPDCGSQLAFIEGCAKCHVCGYSECG